METHTPLWIYTLQLEHKKYYVGKTRNSNYRIKQHAELEGAAWTKLHRPIAVIDIKESKSQHDEDNITLDCMQKYGIDNVRGGIYSKPVLGFTDIEHIKEQLCGINNACFKCGKTGHFSGECKSSLRCGRCLRNNHMEKNCYAKTYPDGKLIPKTCDEDYILITGRDTEENEKKEGENTASIIIKSGETIRIATNTAKATDVQSHISKAILRAIFTKPEETLELIYIYEDTFDSGFDIRNNCIVGLTNLRIFKIERGQLFCIDLANISSIAHQKNGWFYWDRLVIGLKSGKSDSIGIYHKVACAAFCSRISKKINRT